MRDALNAMQALAAAAPRYDFRAACRLVERAHPQLPRIGASRRPQDDALRFGQYQSLAFRPAMLAGWQQGGPAPRMLVNFFGLCGPNGPLPLHLSEYVHDRLRQNGDPTLARFLDIFHHRAISLFYRAWASAQPVVSYDRPKVDRFGDYLGSLCGSGTPATRARDSLPRHARLHYAGRLGARRSAAGLVDILRDYFRLPVRLQQFVPYWAALPDDSLCRLGGGMRAPRLGGDAVLGTSTRLCQDKFRLEIGPLDLPTLRSLLPGGSRARRLRDWVASYAGPACSWDVRVVLAREAVPRMRLGAAPDAARLGWTSWLSSQAPAADDRQLCFSPTRLVPGA